jgi:hypothetical protein
MFKISTEEPKWSSDQAAALRQFLNGSSGQVFLQRLFWMRPTIASPENNRDFEPEKRMAQADQLIGYEIALSEIVALTVSPN